MSAAELAELEAAANADSDDDAADDDDGEAAFPSEEEFVRQYAANAAAHVDEGVLAKVRLIERLVASQSGPFRPRTPYVDARDLGWSKETAVATGAVADADHTAAESAVLAFGRNQAELLAAHWQLAPVSVGLVHSVAAGAAGSTTFPASYHYVAAERTLQIRRARADNVGVFLMVVLHGLTRAMVVQQSHGTADVVRDDSPTFLAAFYDGLKLVCAEMFRARSKTAGPAWEHFAAELPRESQVDELLDLDLRIQQQQ
jgi:hypothetical protein